MLWVEVLTGEDSALFRVSAKSLELASGRDFIIGVCFDGSVVGMLGSFNAA